MSISATAVANLTVVETLTIDVPFAAAPAITHNGLNATLKLSGATTPAGSAVAAIAVPLVAGRPRSTSPPWRAPTAWRSTAPVFRSRA